MVEWPLVRAMMDTHLISRLLIVLAYLMTIGDMFSTNLAIRNGAHEANPAVSWVMGWAGPAWVIPRLLMGQATIAYLLLVGHVGTAAAGWYGTAGLGLQCAVLTFVVWHNFRLAGWWR